MSFTTVMYTRVNKVLRMFNPDYFYRRDLSGVSGKNYKYNDRILEVFRIIDEILNNYNQEYNDELLITCYGFIFRRIEEISCCDISQDEKQYIKEKMYKELNNKLGSIPDNIKYKLGLIVREEEFKEYESFNSRKR